ncbi:MAG: GDP-mannose 4,6-dehydratase [Halioglobus sp.]
MAPTLLLTGADGFTGQHFARAASRRGYSVTPLESDLTDAQSVMRELSGEAFTYVVHLAAISAVTHADELALYRVNLLGTRNLLQAVAAQHRAPLKIIVASSANIYGNAAVSPIDEQAEPAPVNHYAMSKLAMEYMLERYQPSLPLVIARPFNYTGVGHDDRFVIPKLVDHFRRRKAWVELGNTSVEREFNDVRTVCEAYLELLAHGVSREVYNICSGITHSLSDVVTTLSDLTGHRLEVRVNPAYVRENDVQRLCGDPRKLRACIGNIAHIPFADTLRWMLDCPAS